MNVSKISYGVCLLCGVGLAASMIAAEWGFTNADRLGASFFISMSAAALIGLLTEK